MTQSTKEQSQSLACLQNKLFKSVQWLGHGNEKCSSCSYVHSKLLIKKNLNTYSRLRDASPEKAPGSIKLIKLFRRSLQNKGSELQLFILSSLLGNAFFVYH